jgi:hypothetical protein
MKYTLGKFGKFGWKAVTIFLFFVTLGSVTPSFAHMEVMVSGYSVSIRDFKEFSDGFEASLRLTSSTLPIEDVPITCEIYEDRNDNLVDITTESTDSDGDALFEIGGLESEVSYTAYFKIGSTVYSTRSFYTDSDLEENPSSGGCNSGGLSGMAGFVLTAIAIMFCKKKKER